MGHEASGIVAEANTNSKFKQGDKITFDSTIFVAHVISCKSGLMNLCSDRKVLGVSCEDYSQDGAMAEYLLIPEKIAYKLEKILVLMMRL